MANLPPLNHREKLLLLLWLKMREKQPTAETKPETFAGGGKPQPKKVLPPPPVPVAASSTATSRPISPFQIEQNRLASIRQQVAANQPQLKPTGYVPQLVKDARQQAETYRRVEDGILSYADKAAMTLPIPIVGQTLGVLGAGIATGIRGARALNDIKQGDYAGAAVNGGLAALGMVGMGKQPALSQPVSNYTNNLLAQAQKQHVYKKMIAEGKIAPDAVSKPPFMVGLAMKINESKYDPLADFAHLNLSRGQLLREYSELVRQDIPPVEINRILTTRYPERSSRYSFKAARAPLQDQAASVDFYKRNPTDLSRYTPKEMTQFDFYARGSDQLLNLRDPHGTPALVPYIDEGRELLNQGIQKQKLVKDEVLNRGVSDYDIPAGEWKDAAGQVQHTPIKFSELPIGGQHFNKGFTSTSTGPTAYGSDDGLMFAINAPAGKQSFVQMNALPHNRNNFVAENEVLLPHSLWFKKETPNRFSIVNPYSLALPLAAGAAGATLGNSQQSTGLPASRWPFAMGGY